MLMKTIIWDSFNLISRKALVPRKPDKRFLAKHVIVTPPRVKISVAEKIAAATCLVASLCILPTWVLYHIPDYQKENRYEYTGK